MEMSKHGKGLSQVQIKAKIIAYDTTMTRLKIHLMTDDEILLECFVDDNQAGKAFQMENTTQFHEMTYEISDGYNWITEIF